MKFCLISILILLSACGGSDGGGSSTASSTPACSGKVYLGDWLNSANGHSLTIGESCTGQTTDCNGRFTFMPPENGQTVLTVTQSTEAAGCLTVGVHDCDVIATADNLDLTCNGSTLSYVRP